MGVNVSNVKINGIGLNKIFDIKIKVTFIMEDEIMRPGPKVVLDHCLVRPVIIYSLAIFEIQLLDG